MNKIIYILFGTTGEYSDREEWMVKAFTNERSAILLEKQLSEFARVEFQNSQKADSEWDYRHNLTHKDDSGFRMDYTGTFYFINEVELEEDHHV